VTFAIVFGVWQAVAAGDLLPARLQLSASVLNAEIPIPLLEASRFATDSSEGAKISALALASARSNIEGGWAPEDWIWALGAMSHPSPRSHTMQPQAQFCFRSNAINTNGLLVLLLALIPLSKPMEAPTEF
jgi:hypothetical protein